MSNTLRPDKMLAPRIWGFSNIWILSEKVKTYDFFDSLRN